jgi:hypothetical protein
MPAKDRLHDTVKRVLIKAGWEITGEQIALKIGKRRLWIDLQVQHIQTSQVIFVEVKDLSSASMVETFALAVGKFVLYRTVLKQIGNDSPLYLSVPVHVADDFLNDELGKLIVNVENVNLIVFDPIREEIVRWNA